MILKDLLKGFAAHQPQSVGNMSVIPLTAPDSEYHDVGDVSDVDLDRDTDYSSLHLRTRRSSGVTIVPNGLTYITKERAQDRAVHSAHLIKDTKKVGAFCVQSSQCGHMSGQQRVYCLEQFLLCISFFGYGSWLLLTWRCDDQVVDRNNLPPIGIAMPVCYHVVRNPVQVRRKGR